MKATRTPAFRPLKVSLAVAMTFGLPLAHAQQADEAADLGTITVNASADASASGLSKPLAGGQTARGSRIGILGTRDQMEVPFSVTAYTNQLIQDQQSQSVASVLQNDPSIRMARGFGNFQETYFVRGFLLYSDDLAYNGLFGMLPRQYIASELFERVEVLRGASAFLTGATPGGSGIGGTINLLPKRAPNMPLTRIDLGLVNGKQANVAADVARRFGPDGSTGLRITANHRQGKTPVDLEKEKTSLVSAGLDWRNDRARLSADLGYQDHHLEATRPNVTLDSMMTVVPAAPDNTVNWAQPWTYSDEKDTFTSLRGEYDFSQAVTGWFALGARDTDEENRLANLSVSDAAGTATTYRADNARKENVVTGEVGARGKFRTGSVGHEVVVSASTFGQKRKNGYAFDFGNTLTTNLYRPVSHAMPALSAGAFTNGSNLDEPLQTNRIRLHSLALGDTIGLLDDRLLLTAGLRHQTLKYNTYDAGTGVEDSSYSESRTSPLAGAVYRLRDNLSVYANYIEGLTQGDTASGTQANGQPVTNLGEKLPPYVSRQKEVGLKFDAGNAIYTATLFSTDQPRSMVDGSGRFTAGGSNRHQGLELSVQGEPLKNLRVLGGLTLLDAKQRRTGDAGTDGKRVLGVPKQQASLTLDWDTPWVSGLSADARIVHTGGVQANATNTQSLPGWTRLDLGVRYLVDVQGKLVTLRARVDNLTDRSYWVSAGGYPNVGYLVAGSPRTFSIGASLEF